MERICQYGTKLANIYYNIDEANFAHWIEILDLYLQFNSTLTLCIGTIEAIAIIIFSSESAKYEEHLRIEYNDEEVNRICQYLEKYKLHNSYLESMFNFLLRCYKQELFELYKMLTVESTELIKKKILHFIENNYILYINNENVCDIIYIMICPDLTDQQINVLVQKETIDYLKTNIETILIAQRNVLLTTEE